ncbi:hypothetical protein [Metabacillus sp. RGM 3146]|uniref:hypothetical protein n=1 Tax=Metabacillus sp. RGM 3146 TaxID=3401092 RepID=UPI003B9B0D3F
MKTTYRVPPSGLKNILTKKEPKGRTFFAPKKYVHKMGSAGNDRLVTLHLYSLLITGMKVYDLEKCAACIVADDCGVWWPEEQKQIMMDLKLEKVKPYSGRPV